MSKFGIKMRYLGIFETEFSKNYCHIWNQHHQICLTWKFCEKTKISKFGTKNTLSGYFWAKSFKSYCHIWNQYHRFFLIAKFREKNKNALFEYFWARIWKHYCHIWNQHPRICLLAKFFKKTCRNLGRKMPYLGAFGFEFEKAINLYSDFWCRVHFFQRSGVQFFGRSRSTL